jgi:hypothetical protein
MVRRGSTVRVRQRACEKARKCGPFLSWFVRREDAERFIEEARSDGPEVAAKLRIEERELEAGGLT